MGVDYYSCKNCSETFPDCGEYVSCECGEHWCDNDCAEADEYMQSECKLGYEVYDDCPQYGDECDKDTCEGCENYIKGGCKYCREEDFDDDVLLEYSLQLLKKTRYELIKDYKNVKGDNNKEKDQYIIRRVGNYQIGVLTDNEKYSFIIPLNFIQEDKIICTNKNKFLVLRHAFIEDKDFLNFAFNSNQEICVDINSNHEAYINEDNQNVYMAKSKFKGKIKYVSIENSLDSASGYKIIIELTESDLFYKTI